MQLILTTDVAFFVIKKNVKCVLNVTFDTVHFKIPLQTQTENKIKPCYLPLVAFTVLRSLK